MPSRLVFTIGANGSIEGLLKDKVINTAGMGERKIKRITLIEHDELVQRFYIKWLLGPYANKEHSHRLAIEMDCTTGSGRIDDTVLFDTYEDAVEHEIKCVNKLRERGVSFD